MRLKDITGERFGRLVAIKRVENNTTGHPQWSCLCDCGNTVAVSTCNLRASQRAGPSGTKSCGCLKRDLLKGRKTLRNYLVLYRLFLRCARHPVQLSFEEFLCFTAVSECHYCGSPIMWRENFGKDIGVRGKGYNLDRKDNQKGYTTANCVACCKRCNIGKGQYFSYDEWKQLGDVIRTWKK